LKFSGRCDVRPCSLIKTYRRFGGTHCFPSSGSQIKPSKILRLLLLFLAVACVTYFSRVKMESVCSSETSLNLYYVTQCYIPEVRTLQEQKYLLVPEYFKKISTGSIIKYRCLKDICKIIPFLNGKLKRKRNVSFYSHVLLK
jgi:hypothetical protein